ncbi:hypothetical protein [Gimesia sp.]|uniref:leucine-rich repeat domain-containing protein n=1 Tax=Gimesia sp. TaxID=2024833 RepID=UPI0032EC87EC
MGKYFQIKPERITPLHYVRWGCILIFLLLLFHGIKSSFQRKVRDEFVLRLKYTTHAELTFQRKPLIPVSVKGSNELPDWLHSQELKEVRFKFIYNSTSSDTLRGIDVFPSLTHLDLSFSRFSGDALVYLSDLTQLDQLTLCDTNIEDAELAYLKNMRNLRILNLHDNLITDKGLVHLKGLTNLERLILSETEISDVGLIHLSELKNLRNLSLAKTAITGKGLVHLKGLKNLTILNLNNTSVTDAALSNLNGLSQLQGLYLDGTNVTENEQHIWRIALELRAKKNEGKEILVKPRFSSPLPELSH